MKNDLREVWLDLFLTHLDSLWTTESRPESAAAAEPIWVSTQMLSPQHMARILDEDWRQRIGKFHTLTTADWHQRFQNHLDNLLAGKPEADLPADEDAAYDADCCNLRPYSVARRVFEVMLNPAAC